MNDGINIIELEKSHIKKVSRVCASAFLKDPQALHLIPDADARKRALRHIFEFAINYGMLYGKCYATSPNLEGIAIWLSSEGTVVTPLKLLRAGALRLYYKTGGKILSRLFSFVRHSIEVQENNMPGTHWHLFLLAVNPARQGNGYAGALLNSMFRRIDRDNLVCYLETHNEKNVKMYQRYGFQVLHSGPVPDTPVNIWAMSRAPYTKTGLSPSPAI